MDGALRLNLIKTNEVRVLFNLNAAPIIIYVWFLLLPSYFVLIKREKHAFFIFIFLIEQRTTKETRKIR